MTAHTSTGIETLSQILQEFERTLNAERTALKSLDYSGIDAKAQQKLELQARLEFQLHASRDALSELNKEKIQALKKALEQCRTLAKYNDALILAYQEHIKSLQERLSGGQKPEYGPKRRFMAAPSCSQAVLTDTIG